jgi:hypothetical protein
LSAEKASFIDSVFAERHPDSDGDDVVTPAAGVAPVAVSARAAGRGEGQCPQKREPGEKLVPAHSKTSSFWSGIAAGSL